MEAVKMFDINEVSWQDVKQGMRACVFKPTKQSTIQYSEIQPGVEVDAHKHPAEQILFILMGCVDTTIDGKTYRMESGCFSYIPSDVLHHVVNCGNSTTIVMDVFLPERADREVSEKVKDMGHNW